MGAQGKEDEKMGMGQASNGGTRQRWSAGRQRQKANPRARKGTKETRDGWGPLRAPQERRYRHQSQCRRKMHARRGWRSWEGVMAWTVG